MSICQYVMYVIQVKALCIMCMFWSVFLNVRIKCSFKIFLIQTFSNQHEMKFVLSHCVDAQHNGKLFPPQRCNFLNKMNSQGCYLLFEEAIAHQDSKNYHLLSKEVATTQESTNYHLRSKEVITHKNQQIIVCCPRRQQHHKNQQITIYCQKKQQHHKK